MMLPIHEQFIEKVKEKFIRDDRLIGLLAGGSIMTGEMDEYSDLDLIVVYRTAYREEIMNERLNIAEQPGGLLSAFTGEHVGEPRLIICLYGPPPLHIDYKFVSLEELEHRIENPLVLWERGTEISEILHRTQPHHPDLDPQWIEDRFWVWVHYGATKLGRGEWFELIDLLAFIRSTVLGPLILAENGQLPRGVRRLEQYVPAAVAELEETVPAHNSGSCYRSLHASICIYRRLRRNVANLVHREEAEKASIAFLDQVYASIARA
ncbi:nucleotidyltransferase domain-containing protein [Paenibacillus rigui]|uniref:Oxalate:formate antiporter n=1 Tax=Paenibacillus rigui TaxID=554312 RepID=A0A229UHR3_9BACL|nr:nucleotidyltransferase domain-containing protein [Paenibacillus rigui]OXM82913.1 oxalate:formate antiporter [Paenibacillus rigui]